ncbi:hypothetical protein BaRGS_00012135 [Batillaria attramentaria]|uniref:Gamma-secretase-activating protein C-terminal domain-containing protein n=1 Tax=Batillaria attramentaria TaxID=370345 RepID=A0ABD0LBW9_9CAEN
MTQTRVTLQLSLFQNTYNLRYCCFRVSHRAPIAALSSQFLAVGGGWRCWQEEGRGRVYGMVTLRLGVAVHFGFTTVTKQDAGSEGKPREEYQAFLTELQSLDTRVFSLNLKRSVFLKVQFLYPENNTSSASSRDSCMLVFLHKESIGLYKMMSGQPTTEHVVRKFVWAQWDAQNQRLYYIHNYRLNTQHSQHPESIAHKVSAVQFHSGGKYDNMIDVPINFPFPYVRSSTRTSYADMPLHPGIPDSMLNMCVLSQNNGSLCICYQEYIPVSGRSSRTLSPQQSQDEEESVTVDVRYYVCMVHHAKTLHGTATGLPRSLVAGRRMAFQWYGEHLMAVLPGVFCHLLNVNVEYDSCHHILLHNHSLYTSDKSGAPSIAVAVESAKNQGGTVNGAPVTSPTVFEPPSVSRQDSETGAALSQSSLASSLEQSSEENQQSTFGKPLSSPQQNLIPSGPSQSLSSPALSQSLSPSGPSQSLSPPAPLQGSRPSSLISQSVSPASCLSLSPLPRLGFGEGVTSVSVTDGQCLKFLSPLFACHGFSREAGLLGSSLYDARSGCVWRVASNPDRLVEAFRSAYWQTQLAILHYLILLRTRDIFSIRQVFEVIVEDPTSPELNLFLSEYLVASTFASMRKKMDKETVQLLTFTAADTFRGQFEKNSSGERLARVTYSSLDSVNISTKASQERRRRSSEDGWDLLRRSLRLKQMPPPSRFSHEHIIKAFQDVDSSGARKKWTWVNQPSEMSFFDGMQTIKLTDVAGFRGRGTGTAEGVSGRRSRTEVALGAPPLFLQSNTAVNPETKKMASSLTEQLLVSHLVHYLKKESRVKAQNIAKEYLLCQALQSQQLCHLIWSIHSEEDTTAYERLLPKLDEVGTDKEYMLFQVFERFFLATQELAFPQPAGFASYFTSLGFKCLTFSLFLQYVDRGILQLTPDFILQLLEDLPDSRDEDNDQIKFHIISRLPKPFAEDCFRRWHHPVTVHFAARDQVAQILQEGEENH